tara:strand:+ start:1227 stop:1451 length:225 start_codon:yes stop_codon:yes gene_type:complete
MNKQQKYKYRDKHFASWDPEKGFPEDFWNHRVHPITGFYVERESQKKGINNKYSDSEKTLPVNLKVLGKYSNKY